METLKIEAGKFYRTRDGRKAGIYRTDVNHSKYSIHGYVIESDGDEHPRSWISDGRFYNTIECKFDLISEWQEPLDFDWDCLPLWCKKYVAMDENGAWYAYLNEPTQTHWGSYGYDVTIAIPEEYQPKNYTGNWEDSVFKNPNLD